MSAGEYWFQAADGLRLFARVYPGPSSSVPVVLCLHGLTRNGRDFEELAPHLASRYRVVVPDVRGRGLSARDGTTANYQIATYIADLLPLLAGLGAAPVAIVGTSMGGIMAMVMAATQPRLVSRIVLNDVGPEVDPIGLERIRAYAGRAPQVSSWPEAAEQLRRVFGAAWVGLSEQRWQQLARRSYRADGAGLLHADADPAIGDVIRNAANAAPNLWPLWSALVGTPILALRGELSDVLSAATLARMQREKPDLRTVTVRQRGHVPLLDEPEALAAIDAFLAD
jgi:pimeloyl-ACP methyl ester carboxylesterase